MHFNNHSRLEGQHAFLSASKYHWINYSRDKMAESFRTAQAAKLGTRLHEFAAEAIRLGITMPRTSKTLDMYINDAIGFRMTPEQVLRYSDNCFGTADAIAFSNKKLRIHDLKTGTTPTHMEQLEIYTSIFCLEYDFKISDIDVELRIYQNDDIWIHKPERDKIIYIQDKIISYDKLINEIRAESL